MVVIQIVAVAVLRACRRSRLIETMASVRFPSLALFAATSFHVGTGFSASQLVSQYWKYDSWEVVIGYVAFVYAVGLPVLLSVYPYLRVERAFQAYDLSAWQQSKEGRGWPPLIRFVAPTGALFSPETRQAYGPTLSSYRSSPQQVWWTSLPLWTATVITITTLFHPHTVLGCQVQLIIIGLLLLASGVLVATFRPLRVELTNVLAASSRACAGVIFFCAAASLEGDGSRASDDAVFGIGILIMAIMAARLSLALASALVERRLMSDNAPLSVVWVHMLGPKSKTSQQFVTAGDEELVEVAQFREKDDQEATLTLVHTISSDSLSDSPPQHLTTPSSEKSFSEKENHTQSSGTTTPPLSVKDSDTSTATSDSLSTHQSETSSISDGDLL